MEDWQTAEMCWWMSSAEEWGGSIIFLLATWLNDDKLAFLGPDDTFKEVSDLYFTGWKYYLLNHFISEFRETRLVILSHPVLQMGPKPLQKVGSLQTPMTWIMGTYIFMIMWVTAGIGELSPKLDLYLSMDISPGLPSVH